MALAQHNTGLKGFGCRPWRARCDTSAGCRYQRLRDGRPQLYALLPLSYHMLLSHRVRASLFFSAVLITGCAYVPSEGPTTKEVTSARPLSAPATGIIQIVDVNDTVARQLLAERSVQMFSETLGTSQATSEKLGPGDAVEVSIWEAPPATLFGVEASSDTHGGVSGGHATTLPEQMIDAEGFISVPFAGKIKAAGMSTSELQDAIVERLTGKANQPAVLARLTHNASRNATVVGEVTNSLRVPLTPGRERLLDALAAAGGVRQPVNKTTIQVTRGDTVQALPLETIIRDPRQDVTLQAGDVVTAIYAPLSFTAMGATGKHEEISFEAQGINLAQALARAGGLVDAQSDPRGVFIFRFEPKDALTWSHQPVATTPDGRVPVIYRVNLKDPSSFFVMQSFPINNKDLLYVSDAPVTELQKFMNIVFTAVYPILNAKQTFGF
jgi:polysaccharide biosynthesis/export protein